MSHSKKLISLFFDFLALNVALALTYYWVFAGATLFTFQEARVTTILSNLLWFAIVFHSNREHGLFQYTTFEDEFKNLITNYFTHIFVFYLLYSVLFEKESWFFVCFYGLLIVLLSLSRFLLKRLLPKLSRAETLSYITIGHSMALGRVEKSLNEAHLGEINYLGTFGESSKSQPNHLGSVEKIYDFLGQTKTDLILYASNEMSPLLIRELLHYTRHNFIEFKIIPLEIGFLTEGTKLELHNGFPTLSTKDNPIAYLRNRVLKRAFDIVFSLFVIVFILSWLFPIIVILIKMESYGSALFIQDRVGFQEKIFGCFKFRSMSVKENGEVKQATQNDSRVTKTGAFLRKSSLDEMPQFFNVLMGDMSIVGPRPHPVSLDIEFKNRTEDYILRHYTKPGITGWAQVNGFRGPTDTDGKIFGRTEYDLWYLQNWSFLFDLKIIFMTVFGSKVRKNVF